MDNQAGLQAKQIKLTAKQIYHREYDRKRRSDPKVKEREREYRTDPKIREKLIQNSREYRQANKDKIAEEYQKRSLDPEYRKKQRDRAKTPNGKKIKMKSLWKTSGMLFTAEEFERIYNLYLTQELCNACDCVLTRGERYTTPTKACMDHCHENGLFRHIICQSCNVNDNWKKHFC